MDSLSRLFFEEVVHFMDKPDRAAASRIPLFAPSIDRFESNKLDVKIQFYDGHFHSFLDFQKNDFGVNFIDRLVVATPRYWEKRSTIKVHQNAVRILGFRAREVRLCFNDQLDMNLLEIVLTLNLPVHILSLDTAENSPDSETLVTLVNSMPASLRHLDLGDNYVGESTPILDLFFQPASGIQHVLMHQGGFSRCLKRFLESEEVLQGKKLFQSGSLPPYLLFDASCKEVAIYGFPPVRIGDFDVPRWIGPHLLVDDDPKHEFRACITPHPSISGYFACVIFTCVIPLNQTVDIENFAENCTLFSLFFAKS